MADQRISNLSILTGAEAASGDLIEVTDVDAVNGDTSKRMTRGEFFTNVTVASGTAALSSVTLGSSQTDDWNGWHQYKGSINSFVYAGPTFKVSAGATSIFGPGTRVKWGSELGTKYGVVVASAEATGEANVKIALSEYQSLVINSLHYSYGDPPDFPYWFDWRIGDMGGLTGWSTDPPDNFYSYRIVGKSCTLNIRQATNGTSNSATHSAPLPVDAATKTNAQWSSPCRSVDNGTIQTGLLNVASGATTIGLHGIIASANSTASGNSRIVSGQLTYEYNTVA